MKWRARDIADVYSLHSGQAIEFGTFAKEGLAFEWVAGMSGRNQ